MPISFGIVMYRLGSQANAGCPCSSFLFFWGFIMGIFFNICWIPIATVLIICVIVIYIFKSLQACFRCCCRKSEIEAELIEAEAANRRKAEAKMKEKIKAGE